VVSGDCVEFRGVIMACLEVSIACLRRCLFPELLTWCLQVALCDYSVLWVIIACLEEIIACLELIIACLVVIIACLEVIIGCLDMIKACFKAPLIAL